MKFGWTLLLEILGPIAVVVAIFFYGHNAGWHERDATVKTEIKNAVDAGVKGERSACAGEMKMLGGINEKLADTAAANAAKYADAVGSLYDATHRPGGSPAVPGSTGGATGATGDNRLYYADPAAARAALDRANIASDQARKLGGCQDYVSGITGKKLVDAPTP